MTYGHDVVLEVGVLLLLLLLSGDLDGPEDLDEALEDEEGLGGDLVELVPDGGDHGGDEHGRVRVEHVRGPGEKVEMTVGNETDLILCTCCEPRGSG